MRLVLAIALAGIVTGCAAASRPSSAPAQPAGIPDHGQTVLVDASGVSGLSGGPGTLTKAPIGDVAAVVDAPVDSVFRVLRGVYGGLQIPITVDDARARRVGNADFFKSRQFAGVRLSRIVECGSGFSGPNADNYRVYLSLLSQVVPRADGGAEVHTRLVARAQDVASGSSDRLPCGSTGALEATIHNVVRERLGRR